ncbi:lipoprotein-releasing ABC transporter permease subunit LolE [Thalassotalea castellviae]|uniref:Lipoprotein-releasing ABC transporter permease subunit LolE n=1 Tax=Thalassotalea castellviae TaxID=3075612 RepID=A0ABU2ZXR3_9GAMM|nr:lipoprotein-releasing ABC transporter permease subunit LolE [Thalassotalea sp. W431]MDT0602489.1 lipoprotein-releasing ABC transporter permease subunit LolE [Thalassotalea sp. W431]
MMFKPLSVFVGLRYIANRQGKGFTSFISASSTLGITLGVMILILVLSAMNGFERVLAQHLLSIVPHSELISVNDPMEDWQNVINNVNENPNVLGAAPVIKMQGMMQKGAHLKGLELRGVDPQLELTVSSIGRYIDTGTWQDLNKENSVVIGAGIAKKLNVGLGDSVQMLLPPLKQGKQSNQQVSALTKRNLTIVGIFKFGGEIDSNQAYVSLKLASDILHFKNGEIQGIRIKVDDVFNAPVIARNVAYSLDNYLYIYDWTRTQGHLYNDIQLVRMVMFVVLVLVIAVASFNIVSTLIMSVNEKKSDIAILKTMGARSSTIMLTFILQGITNGILGCVVGGSLGVYLAKNLTEFSTAIESFIGVKFLSGDVYFIDFLPTYVNQSDVMITISTALFLTFIATLYPAWRATKVDPAQVLGQL